MRNDDPSRSSENETSDSAAMRWGATGAVVAARNADAGEAVAAREMAAERRRRVVLPIVITSCS